MDIRGGEVTGKQFLLIERHQQLHGLTPVWMREDRSRYLYKQGSDLCDGEVVESAGVSVSEVIWSMATGTEDASRRMIMGGEISAAAV